MNILIFYKHYPVAMGRYIHWGFESAGHKVFSVGHFTDGKIPWGDGMDFPEYKFPPDMDLPNVNRMSAPEILDEVRREGFSPDVLIQAADDFWLEGKVDIPNIVIGTDPHVIDYKRAIRDADRFVSMQHFYMDKYPSDSVWMPYGYVDWLHKRKWFKKLEYHVVFSGLQYENRVKTLRGISNLGWRVYCGLGDVYDEYVNLYNQGMIAFNWSSKNDLPARFWEGLAMKRCVLTNRVPDLALLPFEEGVDYLAFSDIDEAVEKADYYLKRQDLLFKIADNGHKKVKKHSYTHRVKKLLEELGVED